MADEDSTIESEKEDRLLASVSDDVTLAPRIKALFEAFEEVPWLRGLLQEISTQCDTYTFPYRPELSFDIALYCLDLLQQIANGVTSISGIGTNLNIEAHILRQDAPVIIRMFMYCAYTYRANQVLTPNVFSHFLRAISVIRRKDNLAARGIVVTGDSEEL